MTPQEFSKRHEADWQRFETLLERRKPPAADFPRLYRQICTHLALARDRHYPLALVERLNGLALAGQQRLYRHQGGLWLASLEFITGGFPALVRRHIRLFVAAALVFYGPLLLAALLVWRTPELIYSVLPPDNVREFEQMYEPGRRLIGARADDSNFMMFGFYLQHNTGIGFQTFAGGVFAGLGSLYFLFYNALLIGAVAGYLVKIGYQDTFLSFVVTHGAFELTAIVLSGMAGLMLGLALVAPGRHARRDALLLRGREAIRIVYGAAGLFLIAALVESFWSASTLVPASVKYGVGALAWLTMTAYLTLAGRRRDAA